MLATALPGVPPAVGPEPPAGVHATVAIAVVATPTIITARSVAGSFTAAATTVTGAVVASLPVALPAVVAALLLTGGCPAAGTPVPVVATL
ncbi:hypothetical protein AB0L62_10780 [Nocardia asteroides]|uniref:hypothetical protein n=1 Tax=Nocardia asteroides TaxID=1824 RepID=UPI00343EA776